MEPAVLTGDSHVHVVDPPLTFGGLRVGQSHCAKCHRPLFALLASQPNVVIERAEPAEWTSWRSPRTTEIGRA